MDLRFQFSSLKNFAHLFRIYDWSDINYLHMLILCFPGHPKRLPMEIGLMLMANKGPSVPQIIKLLDWEDDTDHYVMVMERPIPCMDLFSFVDHHGGRLDEGMAQNIMRQVIDTAKTFCKRGIFHRDLKLENLLVNEDTMEVKLINFGCSALMKKSAFKVFQGTREYCPPEFYIKGRYHAKPTTVWTLGFILYEMLCGEYPTSYDRHMITVNLWTRPGLSKECCQMICDCLQAKPQERLSLDKMHLHDCFKTNNADLSFCFRSRSKTQRTSENNSCHGHPVVFCLQSALRLAG
uniref:non-specific serine/threonine protein kinase n=1 Tax=Sinocyclocheilus grahami TaxID=75366 RepID=A0A672K0N6_SINGR